MCGITTAILLHFIACNEVRRNTFKSSSVTHVVFERQDGLFYFGWCERAVMLRGIAFRSNVKNIHKHRLTFPSFHGTIIR